MILVGNSNISCFNQQGLELTSTTESVEVHWVGALQIDHFFNAHPAGARVRTLFSNENGWKFLSIGTHDIFGLCQLSSKGQLEAYIPKMQELYRLVFCELRGGGKFCWLFFPQPLHQASFKGLAAKDIFNVSNRFHIMIRAVCKELDIQVIAPLARLVDKGGEPRKEFVQNDGIHLNIEGMKIYLEEITSLTGIGMHFSSRDLLFEPESEVESFCSLLLDELRIQRSNELAPIDFMKSLTEFIKDQLKKRGLDIEVNGETELVASGLLDSLNLVETYTCAVELLKMDIPFDVNLRELNTPSKIYEFLLLRKKEIKGGTVSDGLSQKDFILSLRGDFNDFAQKEQILEADRRISTMDDKLFRAFQDHVAIVSYGVSIRYCVILFWVALNKAARWDHAGALEYLEASTDRRRAFPFLCPRVEDYRLEWQKKNAEKSFSKELLWELPVDASVLNISSCGEVVQYKKDVEPSKFKHDVDGETDNLIADPEIIGNTKIVLAVNLVPTDNQDWYQRQQTCVESINNVKNMNIVPLNICYEDEVITPDQWNVLPELKQSANIKLKVVGKRKPFVDDIFNLACSWAEQNGAGWFAYTNNDIIITAKLIKTVFKLISEGFETIIVSRNEIDTYDKHSEAILGGLLYGGSDVFFINVNWWRRNKRRFHSYILGERAWDNAYTSIMMCHSKGRILYINGLCLHVRHHTDWLTGDYASYNMWIYYEADSIYQVAYCAFTDAVGEIGAEKLTSKMYDDLVTKCFRKHTSLIHPEFINGMTSIIIPVKSFHLNECVSSIKKYTDKPHEIILLEHDASPKLKKQIVKATQSDQNYKLIKIDKSFNFSQSLNEGINQSTGEYIVILFDDVFVCEGWLSDMLECLHSDKKIGIVGAMSDDASILQRVEGIDFKSLENRLSFRETNRQTRVHTRNLDGFCMLFRRDLLIRIGLFDEIFGKDKHVFDDFCVRAVLEGYNNVIAGNVFVHNRGGINKLMTQDKALFDEKWKDLDALYNLTEEDLVKTQKKAFFEFIQDVHLKNQEPAALFSPSVDPHLLRDLSNLPRLRLYIMDNGADIPKESSRLFIDTGIAERIHTISTEDLKKIQGAWDIVVLTASDLVDQNLEDFLISMNFKLLVVSDSLSSIDEDSRVKLLEYFSANGLEKIRENPDVFFWKDKSLWGEYLFSKGFTADAVKNFERALADNPANENALNNLGVISYQLNRYEAAEKFMVKAVSLNRRNINSLNNLVQLYMTMERFEDAAGLLLEITGMNPEQPEPWYLLGLCQERLNQLDMAFDAFKKAEMFDGSVYPMPEGLHVQLEKSLFAKNNSQSRIPPKKILVINNLYPPQEMGGYGRLLFDFTNILRNRGHSIYVLTSDSPYLGSTDGDKPDVHRSLVLFGGWEGGVCKTMENPADIIRIVRKNIAGLEQVLKEFRPDACLLGNIDFLSKNIIDPMLDKKIPIIHHLGNQQPGYVVNETPQNRLYHLAAASNWLKNEIQKQGYPLKDISVVFPGALVEEFRMRTPPALDKLRIVYASIVLPYKGPHILINALKRLHDSGIDFYCSIAGTSTDQGFVDSLKSYVAGTGMEEKIRFLGFLAREELKNLFARHNVLVFPSIVKEAFGISQVEAMAAGLTVVTSGTGGAKEIVEHGVSGIIFKTEDDASLAEELIQLAKYPLKCQQIALAGQRRAIEKFDIERSVDSLESCFARLLQTKGIR